MTREERRCQAKAFRPTLANGRGWLGGEYLGFILWLESWGDGYYNAHLYDEAWGYDHGLVAYCLEREEAVYEAMGVAEEIRAQYPDQAAFFAELEQAMLGEETHA